MPGVQNKSIFRRFESLIDPFKDAPDITPGRVLRFYAYYLLQVWPIFAVLLVVGLAGALVEVALFSFWPTSPTWRATRRPPSSSSATPACCCGWRWW